MTTPNIQDVLTRAQELNLPLETKQLIEQAYRAGLTNAELSGNTRLVTTGALTAAELPPGTCIIGATPKGNLNEYILYRDAMGRDLLINPDGGKSKYQPNQITVDTICGLGRFDTTPLKIVPEEENQATMEGFFNLTQALKEKAPVKYEALEGRAYRLTNQNLTGHLKGPILTLDTSEEGRYYGASDPLGWAKHPAWSLFQDAWHGNNGWELWVQGELPEDPTEKAREVFYIDPKGDFSRKDLKPGAGVISGQSYWLARLSQATNSEGQEPA